ncbi:CRISPR-associated ring nuclease [Chloroflexus sp.]|uniref:CRISPR-associated ring nuclease n=1 Tax=Chloroflexus sp. TaxID=1904827 RepID=UPI003A1023A7
MSRNGSELDDICNESDAEAAFAAIRDLIVNLKAEGRRLHLCISGGRRMLPCWPPQSSPSAATSATACGIRTPPKRRWRESKMARRCTSTLQTACG